jgi:putative tryptophan/tyrosine transport system substrate-binding protein
VAARGARAAGDDAGHRVHLQRIARSGRAPAARIPSGLKETGYVEGENIVIEYRWAESRIDRLPEMVADLIRRQVTVLTAMSGVAAVAAKAANTTIPIVFVAGEDPVRLGLVASLARPGGNATGINFFNSELTAKRLGFLRDLVPTAKRVGVLVGP